MKKTALITGINGQDGAYLAEFLIRKNYRVIGTDKSNSKDKTWRLKKLGIEKKIILIKLNIENISQIKKVLGKYKIDEVYNLAAQSFVHKSFRNPIMNANVTALGALRILETIREKKLKTKFYQASSSEMFGNSHSKKQSEETKFDPQSPYAISKLFAHYVTKNYRTSYNLFAVSGILFNHESPLRSNEFVTKKIINGLIKILNNKKKFIELGNIFAKRDWGYSKEYVVQMWKILQLKKADDFVIATGKSYSIKNFIDIATKHLKMKTKWIGKGINIKLINIKDKKVIVKINKNLFRPSDVNHTRGDIRKAYKFLKWKPKINLVRLVKLMIDEEIKAQKN